MNWNMMRSLYRWIIIISAMLAFLYAFVTNLRPFEWVIGIFAILSFYLSNYRLEVNKSIFVVLLPLALPALVLFGPVWASLIVIIGLLSRDELKKPLPIVLFNDAMLILCVVFAVKVYVVLGGQIGSFHPTIRESTALFAAGFAFELLNAILMVIWKFIRDKAYRVVGESYLSYIWHGIRMFFFSSTLAGIALIAYQGFYVFGILAVFFIAVKLRELFMKVEVDEHYRSIAISDVLRAVYAKDVYLRHHMENVARYSMLIAKEFESVDLDLKTFSQAVLYHDIGKLEIPERILQGITQLSTKEWQIMKTHPAKGAKFAKDLKVFNDHQRKMIQDIAYCHHERYDGSGYPRGLEGAKIPMVARIVAVADAWDAMTTNRSYRPALPREVAKEELRKGRGTQFDPAVVDAFLKVLEEEEEREKRKRGKPQPATATSDGRMLYKSFWRRMF